MERESYFQKGSLEEMAQFFADELAAEAQQKNEPVDKKAIEDDIMNKLIEMDAAGTNEDDMIMDLADILFPHEPAKKRALLQKYQTKTSKPEGANREFDLNNT